MDVLEKEQINASVAAEHWYYESKFCLLKKHILALPLEPASFSSADIGSGLGLFLHKMQENGLASPSRSIGVDPAYDYPRPAFQSDITIYPDFPQGRTYDLLMLMDVLEHVENDVAVLRNAISHSKANGYVFITVPALPFLWSSHDRFLGHFRRYTLCTLNQLIHDAGGLEILKMHYFFAGILPAVIPVRMIKAKSKAPKTSDMKAVSRPLNSLLRTICKFELGLTEHNRIAGLSAVALCKTKS